HPLAARMLGSDIARVRRRALGDCENDDHAVSLGRDTRVVGQDQLVAADHLERLQRVERPLCVGARPRKRHHDADRWTAHGWLPAGGGYGLRARARIRRSWRSSAGWAKPVASSTAGIANATIARVSSPTAPWVGKTKSPAAARPPITN